MNKHRILTVVIITAIVGALALCGTVIAYMFSQTDYNDNRFTPAEVSCKVQEVTNDLITEKSSIKVQNTGIIDAYLRIRFVSYWVDTEGNIVAKPSVMPILSVTDEWIEGNNNTYYCKSSVKPNNSTGELLSAPIHLNEDENGYSQVVEVFAEAIQSKPTDAVINSWNVVLDSNGNITGIN